MPAQQAHADGVKGAQPQAFHGTSDQRGYAQPHLAGRFVGKGDDQKLAGESQVLMQNMSQSGGQHPRLAGAGAGQDQHRTLYRLYRGLLFWVQLGDIGRRRRVGTGCARCARCGRRHHLF